MSEPGAMFHGKHCTKCRTNERVFGQRWCQPCMTAFNQVWRERQREKRKAQAARLQELEVIMARIFRATKRKNTSKGKGHGKEKRASEATGSHPATGQEATANA